MRWVIKLGGSLYASKYLTKWLRTINNCDSHNLIIVPGGGPFADQVRAADEKFSLKSKNAHNMAVLAMQQYAYLLQSLCPDLVLADSPNDISAHWKNSEQVIWEPYPMIRDLCRLQKSWEVTSDSLAAWLAVYLSADRLSYIKSDEMVLQQVEMQLLMQNGCVDAGLQEILDNIKIAVDFVHKSKVTEFEQQLLR